MQRLCVFCGSSIGANPLFAALMRPEIGGVDYDANAILKFGSPGERGGLASSASSASVTC